MCIRDSHPPDRARGFQHPGGLFRRSSLTLPRPRGTGDRVRRLPLLLLCLLAAVPARAEDFTRDPRLKVDLWLEGRLRQVGTDSFLVRFDDSESMAAVLEKQH